ATWRRANGHWHSRRAHQARHWFGEEVRQGLLSVLDREPAKGSMAAFGAKVEAGDLSPEAAAVQMLALLGRG
ncbi:MAG: methylmalonyl Co-A mutase-associated GTPase MeaB, partial [Gemmobacter sp.]